MQVERELEVYGMYVRYLRPLNPETFKIRKTKWADKTLAFTLYCARRLEDTLIFTFSKKQLEELVDGQYTDLLGKVLIVSISSKLISAEQYKRWYRDFKPNHMFLQDLKRENEESEHRDEPECSVKKRNYTIYKASFKSHGGFMPAKTEVYPDKEILGHPLILPYYSINLGLNKEEYNQIKSLPEHTVFSVGLRLKE